MQKITLQVWNNFVNTWLKMVKDFAYSLLVPTLLWKVTNAHRKKDYEVFVTIIYFGTINIEPTTVEEHFSLHKYMLGCESTCVSAKGQKGCWRPKLLDVFWSMNYWLGFS